MKPFPSNEELRLIDETRNETGELEWRNEWRADVVAEPILNALRHISGQLDTIAEILVTFRPDVTGVTSVTKHDEQA